ncbi:MAG: hypothetical protein WBD55_08430 [Dehalococcoidia bacterium]
MPLAISPHFTNEHFREPLSIGDKISLFSDRVRGWQLDIAQYLESHPHAGFGILSIISSYFEMIAKYEDGQTSITASKKYFKQGVRLVLEPNTDPAELPIPETVLDLLYNEVRCGMYHAGITGPSVQLNKDLPAPLGFREGTLTVNTDLLVLTLQDHFSRYLTRLLDPANQRLRDNFEKRFDAGHRGKRLGQ